MAKAKGQGQRKGRGGSRVYGPNHGKNIERRREGDEWFFRFEIDGHEHYGSCRTTDKAKAEGIAADEKAERKVEARRNREDGVGPMRWLAARNNWWNAKGSKNAETGLEARLDWLTEQIGEKTLLRDIDAPMVTRIKAAREQCTRPAGKDDKGRQLTVRLSPAYVKATLVTLRSVINYNGKMLSAAVRMLDWPNWIESDDEENDVVVMKESQQAKIWPLLTDEVRELADFLLDHPKRINEVIPLTKSRIDIDDPDKASIQIKLKGKTKMIWDPIGRREVDRLRRLSNYHPSAIFTYISDRTREYNGVKHVKGQHRPMTYEHFYGVWTAACAEAGVPELTPHCLRHTGATRAYTATRDIYAVSRLLNHRSIDTTVRYYVQNDPEIVRDLKRRIEQGLHPELPPKTARRLRAV
jgi:integrase